MCVYENIRDTKDKRWSEQRHLQIHSGLVFPQVLRMAAVVEGREGSGLTPSEGDNLSLTESIISIDRSGGSIILILSRWRGRGVRKWPKSCMDCTNLKRDRFDLPAGRTLICLQGERCSRHGKSKQPRKFSFLSDLPIASASIKGMTTEQVSSAELGETEEIRRYGDFWFAHYNTYLVFLYFYRSKSIPFLAPICPPDRYPIRF